MKVFVTGGAGYVGSVCAEHLLDRGDEVTIFDNLSEGHRGAVDSRSTFIQGDLNDPKSISLAIATAAPDAVMHFAANALVGESMQNPYKYFHNNVYGGSNLLHAMVENGVRQIVFSSTCAIFGVPDVVPIDENTPKNPINPYGESKLMFEKILRWFHDIHGINFVSFRYFNVAGASQKLGENHRIETHLIPRVLNVPLGRSTHAEIYGTDFPTPDGTCIRDYIDVRDLAAAHLLALTVSKSDFYNLGTGGGTSVKEIIDSCRRVSNHPIPVLEKPRRAGDPPRLVAASKKAEKEIGWNPAFRNIDVIIESAWKWVVSHPNGYND
ncbi:MAG: UDP-glucose 4-epimerase GalE [Verrucomicrobia bacterium]|nr:UDP-glucose 4-epimerase GalE [Verrucomicrobiota bacterium]